MPEEIGHYPTAIYPPAYPNNEQTERFEESNDGQTHKYTRAANGGFPGYNNLGE